MMNAEAWDPLVVFTSFYDKLNADGLGVGIADDGTVLYGPNQPA
jgi:hypothetical protein